MSHVITNRSLGNSLSFHQGISTCSALTVSVLSVGMYKMQSLIWIGQQLGKFSVREVGGGSGKR